jgi:hypothetical protein
MNDYVAGCLVAAFAENARIEAWKADNAIWQATPVGARKTHLPPYGPEWFANAAHSLDELSIAIRNNAG